MVLRLITYKPTLLNKIIRTWLNCGTWYLRSDGKYHDSSNFYNRGLGVADTVEEVVEKVRRKFMEEAK